MATLSIQQPDLGEDLSVTDKEAGLVATSNPTGLAAAQQHKRG